MSAGVVDEVQDEVVSIPIPATRRRRRFSGRNLVLIFPSLWALAVLIPVILMFLGSLRTRQDYAAQPIGWPAQLSVGNYFQAWNDANLGPAYLNNIVVTVATVVGVILLGSLAAYGIVRGTSRAISRVGYALFALGLIVPFQLGLPALYKMWVAAGLVDSLVGIILVLIGSSLPLAVFLYAGFMATIPLELEEAARVDGASALRTYRSIVFPLLGPVHATVVVLTSIAVWNDLIVALFFLQSPENLTLSRATLGFTSAYNNNVPVIYAAAILVIVPIFVLFLFMQRFLVSGITQGALKG